MDKESPTSRVYLKNVAGIDCLFIAHKNSPTHKVTVIAIKSIDAVLVGMSSMGEEVTIHYGNGNRSIHILNVEVVAALKEMFQIEASP